MRICVAALVTTLIYLPARADAVTLLLYASPRATAVERPDLSGRGSCAEADDSGYDDAYANDEAGCVGAGKVWLSEYSQMYDQGMLVTIQDDDWQWGTAEVLPPAQGGKFARLIITDKTKADALKYLDSHSVGSIIKGRRRWRVLVESLPAGVRQQLNQAGYYETDWQTVRSYVYDVVTDTTE